MKLEDLEASPDLTFSTTIYNDKSFGGLICFQKYNMKVRF